MAHQVTQEEIRQAQVPHNLFVGSILLFDLLLAPAVIVMDIGLVGLLLPLALSGGVMAYIFVQSRGMASGFVAAHWKWAYKRCRWLLYGYAVTGGFLLLAGLLSLFSEDPNMKHILLTALTRIALMPTLIMIMVTVVLEASAIGQAGRGEVSEKIPPSAI